MFYTKEVLVLAVFTLLSASVFAEETPFCQASSIEIVPDALGRSSFCLEIPSDGRAPELRASLKNTGTETIPFIELAGSDAYARSASVLMKDDGSPVPFTRGTKHHFTVKLFEFGSLSKGLVHFTMAPKYSKDGISCSANRLYITELTDCTAHERINAIYEALGWEPPQPPAAATATTTVANTTKNNTTAANTLLISNDTRQNKTAVAEAEKSSFLTGAVAGLSLAKPQKISDYILYAVGGSFLLGGIIISLVLFKNYVKHVAEEEKQERQEALNKEGQAV